MALENKVNPVSRRLETWKEIAAYFGRDERTVKRWETSRGLPVRRLPGTTGARVYAYEQELANWMHRNAGADGVAEPVAMAEPDSVLAPATPPPASTFQPKLVWLGLVGVLAILGTIGFFLRPSAPMAHQPTRAAAALYQAGLYEWQTRTPGGLALAAADFKRAIGRDPHYAQAYAGLADCYNLMREYTTMPPQQAYPLAKDAAEHAVALDPSLGEAHASLAFVDFYWSRDQSHARQEFQKALALQPRNATIHHWYATFLMTVRDFPSALSEIEKAQALDPESTAILADKGLILYTAGRRAEATALLQRLEQAQPNFMSPHVYLASFAFDRGDDKNFLYELATAAAEKHDASASLVASAGAQGLGSAGRSGMLKAMLAVQERLYMQRDVSAYDVARTFAHLGDAEDAIIYLKASLSRHETDNIAIGIDPAFNALRKNADFNALVQQAGLKPSSA
ncbi:MAG TPA: hypothetical protein VGG10_09635 [Rhizomicrobium sp.]|jgi:Tfp pilus assembly protein PilF